MLRASMRNKEIGSNYQKQLDLVKMGRIAQHNESPQIGIFN